MMRHGSVSSPRRHPLLAILAGAGLALVTALVAIPTGGCASAKEDASPVKCTPGKAVFCTCQDREQGTKLCNDDGKSFGTCDPCESASNPAIPDDPYTPPVEVDADAGADAQEPATAGCGDKIVQDGEDCDDGNKTEDDGCDSKCKLAGSNPVATRSCPGLETHVWSNPVTYVGTTVGSTFRGSLSPQCNTSGQDATSGAAGPDRVFDVTAHKTGTMTVTTTDTDYDSLIYVTTQCVQSPAPITYAVCAHDKVGVGGETLSLSVTAGKHYSVIVDGAGVTKPKGNFKLTLAIQ
jgi:cysteine-rich repeat protein